MTKYCDNNKISYHKDNAFQLLDDRSGRKRWEFTSTSNTVKDDWQEIPLINLVSDDDQGHEAPDKVSSSLAAIAINYATSDDE